jgi:biopolymer transport protein ExbB/TolQ
MSKPTYYKTLSSPQVFMWRMFLFVVLAGLLAATLRTQIIANFEANRYLNSLIIGVMGIGIIYAFQQVLRLYPEIRWVNNFRIADPGLSTDRPPVMLAPMATLLRRRQGQAAISTNAMRSILDSIASRLDETRETTRYMVGLLIFLGLLGTFWGLLETVQSVGQTINSLSTENKDSVAVFDDLKNGLAKPLNGMGTAFSASLFGLAGSLILGFLDLQASQAQNRFYNETEEWLSGITEMGTETTAMQGAPSQLRFALLDMQKSVTDLAEKMDHSGGRNHTSEAMRELSKGIDGLVKQMRAEQKVVREWVEEQAHQQAELTAVLRDQNKLATVLRDIVSRAPKRDI